MKRVFEDANARFVRAWGIVPVDLGRPRAEQTTAVFHEMERILSEHGMTFANVVRTWFYCDHINDWYGEFNAARTEFFESRGVFGRFLPASTGIGHGNPFGAALIAGFIAMAPKGEGTACSTVASPLQTEAMTYRSSFSRAAEIVSASGRRLFVSGTASILPNSSEVAFVGDPARQVDCAMRAAFAIVESRGMSAKDVTGAIVYLKDESIRQHYLAWLRAHGLADGFATVLIADVCRPEWLFEVEMECKAIFRARHLNMV